jgi:nucleoside-diphosphate-sugar epimerase
MRIFLTGATGYIGSAVLDALVKAGHEVSALVRTAAAASRVAARGARPVTGDLSAPDGWLQAAAGHDAYVHAAFEPSPRGPQIEQDAVEALLGVARGSRGAAFLYTSGIWVLGNTREPAAEDAPLNPTPLVAWRPAVEQRVLAAGADGLRAIVVRPGIVYGGARGIVSDLLKDADNGLMRVIGTGENHWPVVYDRDLADLYVRLIEHPEAAGIYHANDESDQTVNDIVGAIAAHAPSRPEIRHMPLAEARARLGPYADALALDQIVRSPRARALGWAPSLGALVRNVPRLFEEWRNARAEAV